MVDEINLKIVIIGDAKVGKSTFLAQYIDGKFRNYDVSTQGMDFKIKKFDFKNQKVKLSIWDTAGQEKYEAVTINFFKNAQGAVIAFDLTDKVTFENINKWIRKLRIHGQDDLVRVLIGTKQDLSKEIVVDQKQIDDLCKENNIKYYGTSSKENKNIKESMDFIIDLMMNKFFNTILEQQDKDKKKLNNGKKKLNNGKKKSSC